jgi:EamA domain-containing membrane protein RarD
MKHLTKHLPHYISLGAILIAGIVGFWVFQYDRLFQASVAVAVAVSYVVWGIVHHSIHDDLHASVVVEYLLVASLGLIIVFSLIFRA